MIQYQIHISATDPARAELMADVLGEILGDEGTVVWYEVEEGNVLSSDENENFGVASPDGLWAVDGFIFSDEPEELQAVLIEALTPLGATSVTVQPVEDRDWVSESLAGLKPVVAGRFVVHGSHDRGNLPFGKIPLEIEANQAFGTGHHPTTAGCLIALTDLMKKFRFGSVLDLGCGSGVLAMAYERLTHQFALASDIDPMAVEIAKGNLRANGAGHNVHVVAAAGFGHAHIRNRVYDLVFANILAGPLMMLAPEMAKHVVPSGRIILSGLLNTQARAVDGHYRAAGFRRERHIIIGDWSTLVLRR